MCELQQPTRCKSKRVKRKCVTKPKVVPVKSNVGKRKRLDGDVASEEHVSDEEDKESEEDKGSEEVDETNEAEGAVKKSTKEIISKPKKLSKKKKQVSEDEKPLKNKKKRAKQGKDVKKKTKKPPTPALIKRDKYFNTFPARLARFVVKAFSGSSYEFKLDKGIIRMTPEKVHEILGVPLGGTSIFDLPEIPLDDPFVKVWFKQFHPKPLKDIHAYDIADKLVLTKRVDFMFKVNFFMLFANVMGTAETMKAIVNLTLLRRICEDTNAAATDWCGFIHKCLHDSSEPKTVNGFYIGIRIQEEVIHKLDLHGTWTESEVDQTEGFYDVGDNVSWSRTFAVRLIDGGWLAVVFSRRWLVVGGCRERIDVCVFFGKNEVSLASLPDLPLDVKSGWDLLFNHNPWIKIGWMVGTGSFDLC
nr:hypothetical protein [Tanacetum cinerariifolium]